MVVVNYGASVTPPKSNEFEDMTQYDFDPKIAPIKSKTLKKLHF